jgi:hypothetical protein
MNKYLPLLPVLLLFASCTFQRPISRNPPVNNETYRVDYLFEHEGCKVYRFFDQGNYVYFTNCKGEAIVQSDSTAVRNSIHLANKK